MDDAVASVSLRAFVLAVSTENFCQLTKANIHVIAAAGNMDKDAANYSPARAPSAITVGASTISDARWRRSNYGSVVDLFAPGSHIVCTDNTSTTVCQSVLLTV
jgi:Subtilase family.